MIAPLNILRVKPTLDENVPPSEPIRVTFCGDASELQKGVPG